MKVNKQFVQEVANGKYSDYDTRGEMKRAAQCILEEKVVSKFSTFCFRMFGGELPDNVMDVFDAFVDFKIHGAEIRLEAPDSLRCIGAHQIFGMTPFESLEELWRLACEHEAFYEYMRDHEFKIAGEKGMFVFNPCALRHYFDKGGLDKKEFLEMCRAA